MSETITVGIEKSEISSAFNAFVLQVLLMGMYIVIYIGTMYTYVPSNASNPHVIPATITVQCLASIAYTGFQWYGMKHIFIDNGSNRNSVFVSLFNAPQWLYVASAIMIYIIFVLADGLLIWRCFYIWDCSLRVILVPLLLLIAEFGLFLVQIVLRAMHSSSSVSPATSIIYNNLLSTAYFMTFATSSITTALIAYRIYGFINETDFSKRKFKHILDIVVQSGAAYSLTVLVTAISTVLPGSAVISNTRVIDFQDYITYLGVYISGMSVTIMVARIGRLSGETVHLSGLQFNAPTSQADVEQGAENAHSTDGDKITSAEGEKTASEAH